MQPNIEYNSVDIAKMREFVEDIYLVKKTRHVKKAVTLWQLVMIDYTAVGKNYPVVHPKLSNI